MYQPETSTDRAAPADGRAAQDHRTLGELVKELRDETSMLLRQEVELARTEMTNKAMKAGRNVGYLAAGGAVAVAGLLFLLLAVTGAIAVGLDAAGLEWAWWGWLAPLITGTVVLLIGYGLVQKAIQTFRHPDRFVPHKTVDSMQENKEWATHKIRT